jgi:hypothetical protein
MNDHNNIENTLHKLHVRELSSDEKNRAWSNISARTSASQNWLLALTPKPMITSIALALVLALGLGGTVVAADDARPGDALFRVDRAAETIRLALATDDTKSDLRLRFAEERLQELEELREERSIAVSESAVSEIEADAFTNETVVKIEFNNGQKFVYTLSASVDTRDEVIADIVRRFNNVSRAFVDARLNFEVEDRASRPNDKDDGNRFDDDRISTGIQTAASLLVDINDNDDDRRTRLEKITTELNRMLADLPDNAEIDIRSNGDDRTRVEIESDEGRTRVEFKDGEFRVKTKESKNNSGSGNSNDDRDDDSNDDRSINGFEAEADIFTNQTVIKIEVNGQKTVFTTTARTREAIIDRIMERLASMRVANDITRAQVNAVLDLEVEDRASRQDDLRASGSSNTFLNIFDNDNNNDDNDDDNGRNRGRGRGGDDNDDDNSGSGNSGSGGGNSGRN